MNNNSTPIKQVFCTKEKIQFDLRYILYLIYYFILVHFIVLGKNRFTLANDMILLTSVWVLLPLAGACIGLLKYRKKNNFDEISYWGSGLLFCLGILSWAIGEIIYSYYNFINKIELPYPSIADFGFLVLSPMWLTGGYKIYRTHSQDILNDIHRTIPIFSLMILGSFGLLFFFSPMDEIRNIEKPEIFIRFVLNIVYTVFDCSTVCLFLSLILGSSYIKLNKEMRRAMSFATLGVLILFFSNLFYGVCTALPSDHPYYYHNGGWIDFLFHTALLILSISLLFIPENSTEMLPGQVNTVFKNV